MTIDFSFQIQLDFANVEDDPHNEVTITLDNWGKWRHGKVLSEVTNPAAGNRTATAQSFIRYPQAPNQAQASAFKQHNHPFTVAP